LRLREIWTDDQTRQDDSYIPPKYFVCKGFITSGTNFTSSKSTEEWWAFNTL